jgi:hypothetical protein
MKLHLRLDHVNSSHIHETLFFNGINIGTLIMTHGEYQSFSTALLLGAAQMKDNLILEIDPISHDRKGNFIIPVKEK